MRAYLGPSNNLWQLLVILLSTLSTASPLTDSSSSSSSSPPRLGAVASESSVCSRIGTDLLKRGGNAVDALVGTVLCVGVIGMYHSGIGGGGFMIVRNARGQYEFVDFRETAPRAAHEDMFRDNEAASIFGGLASGVPGELRGLEYVHKKYGKLSWQCVVEPAVGVARNGFPVTEDLVRYIKSAPNAFLSTDPSWAIDFAPRGRLLKVGEIMTRRRYADTLETISLYGADAFYRGPIANATISALRRANGTMALEDLRDYQVAIRPPASITYRGFRLHSCSAPSSGTVALAALKIVEGYDGFGDAAQINLTTHRLDEAMRFAYGMRANLGDPSFPITLNSSSTIFNITAYQEEMLSSDTASLIRSHILSNSTLPPSAYDPSGLESLDTPGTSHVVTADSSGIAASLTTTINLLFGSQIMVPETGVIMNNEMNDFSIPGSSNAFGYVPSPANFIRPGKRPLSSISPTIVELPSGQLYFVIGAAGGSRIITATIQNLHHVLDEGMTAPEALARPRLHDQLAPNQVSFEWAYDNATVAFMRGLGHNVTWVAPGQSTAQGLRVLANGTFEAAGEPRQKNSGGFAV